MGLRPVLFQFRASGLERLKCVDGCFFGYASLIELMELRGFGRTYGA